MSSHPSNSGFADDADFAENRVAKGLCVDGIASPRLRNFDANSFFELIFCRRISLRREVDFQKWGGNRLPERRRASAERNHGF